MATERKERTMSYRLLRFFAGLLNVIGWLFVIGFTGVGFLPWMLSTIEPIPVEARWQSVVIYGAPVVGCLIGALGGLGFFILAQIIRALLAQLSLQEEILQSIERRFDNTESPPERGSPGPATRPEPIGLDDKTL